MQSKRSAWLVLGLSRAGVQDAIGAEETFRTALLIPPARSGLHDQHQGSDQAARNPRAADGRLRARHGSIVSLKRIHSAGESKGEIEGGYRNCVLACPVDQVAEGAIHLELASGVQILQ
jgi:hypothetical protein